MQRYDFLRKEAAKYPGITAKKCISGPNMILVDNYLQMGIKEVPYYGSDVDALIDDIALAYQAAIRDLYDHGCRYLQIDDTSWTYMIDENFCKRWPGWATRRRRSWSGSAGCPPRRWRVIPLT